MYHYRSIHFPIALLLVGACVEILAVILRKEEWHAFSVTLLVFGSIGTIVGVSTGLWIEASYNDPLLATHKKLGLACLGTSLLAVIAHLVQSKLPMLRYVRTALYVAAAVLVAFAGHYGGTMAHGGGDKGSSDDPDATPPGVISIQPKKLPPRRTKRRPPATR